MYKRVTTEKIMQVWTPEERAEELSKFDEIYDVLQQLENLISRGHYIYVGGLLSGNGYKRVSVCDILKASNWHFNTIAVLYYCSINNCSTEEGIKGVKTLIAQHNRLRSKSNKKETRK